MHFFKPILLAVMAIAFATYSFDCLAMSTPDAAMQCCDTMHCPSHSHEHSQECCKTMVSSQSPSVLPVAHVTLHAPVMVVTDILASPQAMPYPEASRLDFEAPQHSPPELYTLHASLLI
jgi:hypothetical protein